MSGHTQLMLLDSSTICKPLIERELFFYLNIPESLHSFVPRYKGKDKKSLFFKDYYNLLFFH